MAEAVLRALACLGPVAVEEDTAAAAAVAAFVVALVLVAAVVVADTVAADTVAAAAVAVAPSEDHLRSFGQEEAWHLDSPASFPSGPDV